MPTGYTAGILDGTIKTFPEFAKTCMRAFGATIHMRDDSLEEEYIQRIPSDYHVKEITRVKSELKKATELSDHEIMKLKIASIKKDIKWRTESKLKGQKDAIKLNEILEQVKKWNPPTTEHTGLKSFMIEQIESTIDFDCKLSWVDKDLERLESELTSVNAQSARKAMIDQSTHDLEYHIKENNEEIKRCEDSNKWVVDLLNSFKS